MTDRRVQRTREMLQKAMINLISEHSYDTITIQDIVDRANVGRTTFYLHYNSKEELFVSCHMMIAEKFQFSPVWALSREELISLEPPPGLIAAYLHFQEARLLINPIFQGKDGELILRRIRDSAAQEIETGLHANFSEAESAIPFKLLASYLAGAQIGIVQWWLEKRQPYAPEVLARAFHRLQRASICDALAIKNDDK